MQDTATKSVFFASDHHLGAPDRESSMTREKVFVEWLESIAPRAEALFLLGDLFDFWFEYKSVVPKGFVRVLGTLARLADSGLPIYYFVGNHDLWMKNYFETELGIPVYHSPQDFSLQGKTLLIGHGDGLGPGDNGYKRMKKVFTNPFAKWLYRWLHPDIGVPFAQYLSLKNRLISGDEDIQFLGEEQEWLAQYSRRKLSQKHRDYFIFGHRHLPMEIAVSEQSTYFNLGDWIQHFTYGELQNGRFALKTWEAAKA
ncbi:MAG: UDP-2,3-diacylglucosamine diphosphatase [Flavobacteriaceae bacterium]